MLIDNGDGTMTFKRPPWRLAGVDSSLEACYAEIDRLRDELNKAHKRAYNLALDDALKAVEKAVGDSKVGLYAQEAIIALGGKA